MGGLGVGLLEPPTAPPTEAEPEAVDWDNWVGDRAPAPPVASADVIDLRPTEAEVAEPEAIRAESVSTEAAMPGEIVVEAAVPEPIVPEAVVPTIVQIRATGALDAAALDAANAAPVGRGAQAPPAGGRRGRRFGGR